jgi:hypothetical protein
MKQLDKSSAITEHVMRLGQCATIDDAYNFATKEYNQKQKEQMKARRHEQEKFKKYIDSLVAIPHICLIMNADGIGRVNCLNFLKEYVSTDIGDIRYYCDNVVAFSL